jgi:hypothetical protein
MVDPWPSNDDRRAVITLYGVTGGLLPLLKHWIHLEVESTRTERISLVRDFLFLRLGSGECVVYTLSSQ